MANQSYVHTLPALWRRFFLFDAVDMSVYCFGFLSNIPILWIFYTEGFASTSNINFFALGVADLCVCILFIVDELVDTYKYYTTLYIYGKFGNHFLPEPRTLQVL